MYSLFEKLKRLCVILWIILSTSILSDGFTINKTVAVTDSITENGISNSPQSIDNGITTTPRAYFAESTLNNKNEWTTETNVYTDSVMDDGNDTGDIDSLLADWRNRAEYVEAIQSIPKRGEKISSPYEKDHTSTDKNLNIIERSSITTTETVLEINRFVAKNGSFVENSSPASTSEKITENTSFYNNQSYRGKSDIVTLSTDSMATEEITTPNEFSTMQIIDEKTRDNFKSTEISVVSLITTTNPLQPQGINEIDTKITEDKDINYSNIVLTSKLPSEKRSGTPENESLSSRHFHKSKNVYTLNPNIKRYKKIEIKPPKPIWRDPDDNSWRNESISSLGITVKLNDSPKPFSFKNKTVNLTFDAEFFTESYNDSSLRDRLEKLSQQRKTMKTTPKSNSYYSKKNYNKSTEDTTSTKLSYDRYYKEFVDPEFESEIAALSEYYGKKIFPPEYARTKTADNNKKVSRKIITSTTEANNKAKLSTVFESRKPTEYSNEYNHQPETLKKSDLSSFKYEESASDQYKYKNPQYTIASSYYLQSPSISVSNQINHPETKYTFHNPVSLENGKVYSGEYRSGDLNIRNKELIEGDDHIFSNSESSRNRDHFQYDSKKQIKSKPNLEKAYTLSSIFVTSRAVDYHNTNLDNINESHYGVSSNSKKQIKSKPNLEKVNTLSSFFVTSRPVDNHNTNLENINENYYGVSSDSKKQYISKPNLENANTLSSIFVTSRPIDYHNTNLESIVQSEIVHDNPCADFPPSSDDKYRDSLIKSNVEMKSKYVMRPELKTKENDLFQKIFDEFVSSKAKSTTRLNMRQPMNREITQLYP